MVRPPEPFAHAAEDWVCVRITDMRDVDLNQFEFDYGLTFAAFLMHPDGTVYHRYGGRDHANAMSWISLRGLQQLMASTLEEHATYSKAPDPPPRQRERTIADYPTFAQRVAQGQKIECVHCHTVHDEWHASLRERGEWTSDDLWVWPVPGRVGVTLDPESPARIDAVAADSPASRAGLARGDRLERIGQQTVRSIADLQWVLHRAPPGATELPLRFSRGAEIHDVELRLDDGWKVESPREFAWRPLKWNIEPAPGFGGPLLDAAHRQRLGLDEDVFAFRVQYLVTWGAKAATGRNAARAGIRKGDVVLSIDGKDDFESVDHFHAWVRLAREVGDTLRIRLLRGGRPRDVELELVASRGD